MKVINVNNITLSKLNSSLIWYYPPIIVLKNRKIVFGLWWLLQECEVSYIVIIHESQNSNMTVFIQIRKCTKKTSALTVINTISLIISQWKTNTLRRTSRLSAKLKNTYDFVLCLCNVLLECCFRIGYYSLDRT